jgi:hypothetical protein
MYNQLRKQGIKVKYEPRFLGKDIEQWALTKEGTKGLLTWFRGSNKWSIQGFTFVDEQGKSLEEFLHVAYH